MIEMKVSFDTDSHARAGRHAHTGARWRCTPEEKVGVEDPIEMQRLADALPAERTATRWIVVGQPGGAGGARSGRTSTWASRTWCSTSPARTRSGSCACTPSEVLPLLREP